MKLAKFLAWETCNAPRKPGRRSNVTWDHKFWVAGSKRPCQLVEKQKGHSNPWILLYLQSYVVLVLCASGSVRSFVRHDVFGRIKCLGIKNCIFLHVEECLMANGTNCSIKESVWLLVAASEPGLRCSSKILYQDSMSGAYIYTYICTYICTYK